MEQSEERGKSFFLPKNFQNGISIGTRSYSPALLLQGVILALLPVLISYWILPAFGILLSVSDSLGTVLMFSTLLGYAGIHGAKGGTLLQFLKSVIRFYQSRRTAYYNPRIKAEAGIGKEKGKSEKELPGEKLQKLFAGMRRSSQKRPDPGPESEVREAEDDSLFFEEDIGIVETPVEYMTPKEYRAYRKKLRKEERLQRKEEKQNRKEEGNEKRKAGKAQVPEASAEHPAESSDQRAVPRDRPYKG